MSGCRVILHSDMNAFYASVEMMLCPSLRGKAVAVCGAAEDRHGIVLAKSESAKKAGVKTGMVSWEAKRLCPDLIFVLPQYDEYLKYSRLAHEIYSRYTDLIEPYGMDECWLELSSIPDCRDGTVIADRIRHAIREELGLTVSIGVSFNKIFAKLGSDMKKPDAVTEITEDNYRARVWPLPVSELLFVGRASTRKLSSFGIRTIGDLAATDPALLRSWLGVNGERLWLYANGLDQSRVMHQDFASPVKSIGHGITCVSDLENEDEVRRVMLELSQDVSHRLRVHGLWASGVQIGIRGNDLLGNQFQCKLPTATQLSGELTDAGFRLFQKHWQWKTKVRAVTISGIDLRPAEEAIQLSLFSDLHKREQTIRMETAVEEIRRRYGRQAVTRASLLCDLKMPRDGRDKVRMPGLMYQ